MHEGVAEREGIERSAGMSLAAVIRSVVIRYPQREGCGVDVCGKRVPRLRRNMLDPVQQADALDKQDRERDPGER
jgi:hypothetical protein